MVLLPVVTPCLLTGSRALAAALGRRLGPRRAVLRPVVVGTLGCSLVVCRRRRQALAEQTRKLERVARTDPLTGIPNRRHGEEHLALARSAARRHGQPVSVLFIDVDDFKRVNDELGHQVGDAVLRAVGERIRLGLRTEDVVGRWGGEEFLAVLPMTGLSGAVAVAERLRFAIAGERVQAGAHAVGVTVSIGCALGPGVDPTALLGEADVALYRAKQAGRNCVAIAPGAEA